MTEHNETSFVRVVCTDYVPPTIKEASSLAGLHKLLEKMARENFVLGEYNRNTEQSNLECEESGHELEDDIEIDSEFSKCAKNALVKLQAINRSLERLPSCENPVLADSKEVEMVLRQLTEKEVYLCVLGRYNVGKTTLINALLYADILPTSRDAETAVTLYIHHNRELEGHNPWMQSSSDLKGPCLTKLHGTDKDAIYGMQNIKAHLEEVHRVVRKGDQTKIDYRLKTSIPVFAALPEDCIITPYLVDTAGSNEAGQTELQHMALVNRRTAAVYIYVMSYSQLRNEQDYEALRDIFQRDKSIFEDGRMMIVITHVDMSYNQVSKELTEEEVKATVISQISRLVPEVTVLEERIVLISGLWAYESRVCKGTDGGSLSNSCRLSLMSLHKQSDFDSIFKLSTDSMCSKLVDASGIEVLEARLRDMVQHLFHMWKTKIIFSCQGMLQAAIGALTKVDENTQQRLREAIERSTHCRDVERLHAQLLKSIDKDSPILSTLGAKYDKDTQPDIKFTSMMETTISKFMKNLESKVKRRSYTPEDFEQDVNEPTFLEEVELEMKNLYSQTKFNACHEYLRKQLANFSDKFGRLKASAVLLYEHDRVRSLTICDDDEDATGTIDEIVEQTNKKLHELNIPQVTYGFKERIKLLFDKLLFGRLKVRIISPDHLQIIQASITTSLQDHQREFFKDIREPVVLYFFKIFCQRITNDLTTFHNLVEAHKWKIMESLNAMKKEQQQMEQIVSKCEEWKTQLQELKDQVETHSGHNDSYKNAAC